MDTTVKIALITSATSILLAVLSLITAIFANRLARESAKLLADHKTTIDKHNQLRDEAFSHFKVLLRAVQSFRDQISLLISKEITKEDLAIILPKMNESRAEVLESFSKLFPYMDEIDISKFHSIKKLVEQVCVYLESVKEANVSYAYSNDLSVLLKAYSEDIKNLQYEIRETRLNLFISLRSKTVLKI